jgi:hypothetical protein
MTADEAAREIADLRNRVQRLEDAIEGLVRYTPRLCPPIPAVRPTVGHREPDGGPQGDAWPPGATFAGWR